jgi:hypothetical protein
MLRPIGTPATNTHKPWLVGGYHPEFLPARNLSLALSE